MALLILLALVGLPLLEIAVFVEVGDVFGLTVTLGLTVLTAAVGVLLMRTQGLTTLIKLRESLNQGDVPVRAVFDGACQLIAGGFLLIPGFVTDFAGLLLFIPIVRHVLLTRLIASASIIVVGPNGNSAETGARRPYDVEAEYEDVTPSERKVINHSKNDDDQD